MIPTIPTTGDPLKARVAILDAGAAKCRDPQMRAIPKEQALLMTRIGAGYHSVGEYRKASDLLVEALEIGRREFGEVSLDVAEILFKIGWVYHDRGEYEKALRAYDAALAMQREVGKTVDTRTLVLRSRANRAWLLGEMGECAESIEEFTDIAKQRAGLLGQDHRDVLMVRLGLAATLIDAHRYTEALPIAAQAVEALVKLEGDETLLKAAGLFQNAVIQMELWNNQKEAEKLLVQCLEMAENSLGKKHIYIALILFELAVATEHRDPVRAEQRYRDCLQIVRLNATLAHPRSINLVHAFARLLMKPRPISAASTVGLIGSPLGQGPVLAASALAPEEANALFREQIDALQERFGKDHFFVAKAYVHYGLVHFERNELDLCVKYCDRALPILRKSEFSQWEDHCDCLLMLGICSRRQGKDAGHFFKDAQVLLEKQAANDAKAKLVTCLVGQALSRIDAKHDDEAVPLLCQAGAICRDLPGSNRAKVEVLFGWIQFHLATNHPSLAAQAALENHQLGAKNPDLIVKVARSLAQRILLVGKDKSALTPEEQTEKQDYADQAVAILRLAVKQGFRDVALLKKDADFQALSEHGEFQKLIQELEQQPSPQKP